MSAIQAYPCKHSLGGAQCVQAFASSDLVVRLDAEARDVFAQLNAQLTDVAVSCPLCERRIEAIEPVKDGTGLFPVSTALMAKVRVTPITVELKAAADRVEKVRTVINFRRVTLRNIQHGGRDAIDGGVTYGRLAELADDFNGLTSAFGWFVGRLLYWLPVSWKAKVYIDAINKAQEKGLADCNWVLSDQHGRTIGMMGLTEIDKGRFDLDEPEASQRLFNVGVLLHSDFQRRGVVTEVTNHLYDRLVRLRGDIDGLWIATRPDNAGVNHIANKLHFNFIKEMAVEEKSLLPCVPTYMPQNLYVKPLYEASAASSSSSGSI